MKLESFNVWKILFVLTDWQGFKVLSVSLMVNLIMMRRKNANLQFVLNGGEQQSKNA